MPPNHTGNCACVFVAFSGGRKKQSERHVLGVLFFGQKKIIVCWANSNIKNNGKQNPKAQISIYYYWSKKQLQCVAFVPEVRKEMCWLDTFVSNKNRTMFILKLKQEEK